MPTSGPSTEPTNNPTPLPYCPPAYDPLQTNYAAGQLVEVDLVIFQCSEELGYEMYCNIYDWDDVLLAQDVNAKEKWDMAWVEVSACYTTQTPTAMPSDGPTASPITEFPTREPIANPTKEPSG